MIKCLDTGETVDTYKDYMLTEHWRNFRASYYKRHPKKCSECGTRKKIHLHHLSYDNIGRETDSDVIPLCIIHHALQHKGTKSPIEIVRMMLRSEPFILVHIAFVDLFGSIDAAIYFEHLRNETKRQANKDEWVVLTKAKITKATTLSRKRQDGIRRKMIELGVLEKKVKKDKRGIPVLHQRIKAQRTQDLLDALPISRPTHKEKLSP